jgi:L-alanine-DL-glutamate epimerase-like enolase superfamily enzyme
LKLTSRATDEGLYGIGEGTLNYFGKTVESAIHKLKALILGMDLFQVEGIAQRVIVGYHRQGLQPTQARRSPVPSPRERVFRANSGLQNCSINVVSILQPEPLNLGGIYTARKIDDEFNEPWEKLIVTNPVEVVDGWRSSSTLISRRT